MGTPGKQRSARTFSRAIVMLLIIIGGTAGCAALKTGRLDDGRVKTIWQSREQYVAIEPQDHPEGAAVAANAHPGNLSVERLRSALESIEVHIPGKDSYVPLFNEPELAVLSEKLSDGLAQAGPGEDVTFAVVGQHSALMGLMKAREITVGRVFCLDGRLNIIFGDLLRDLKDNEDRRLFPFIAGSRGTSGTGSWTLTSKSGYASFTLKRQDWLQFPVAAPPETVSTPTPSVTPSAGRNSSESGAGSSTYTSPASPVNKVAPVNKSTEERLRTLNDLHRKNLVTDEEYRAKRREILDGL
jgi:hypothetical protein